MNKKQTKTNSNWWTEKYGFFGKFYMEGDASIEGFLTKKMSLSKRTKREVVGIIRILGLKRGMKVLDAPCGYGRHSIELARKGINIVGSDINSTELLRAKREAKKQRLDVKFVKENMLDIEYKKEFDAVINMFYSFGFFNTDKENNQVLKNFYNALKPGGKFLMHTDVNIPRIKAGKYKLEEERRLISGGRLKIIDKYNPKTKRIEGVWIITKSNGRVEEKHYSVRVYEKDEFIRLCKRIGFKNCVAYSSWDKKPYSKLGEEIMFVAEK